MTNFINHSEYFFHNIVETSKKINFENIETIVNYIKKVKNSNGRLFILGLGGSAANSSHAVNDFRKLCNIETYSPVDNISEITAIANDNGFENIFLSWIKTSKVNKKDFVIILSVGGGNLKKKISLPLIKLIKYLKDSKIMTACIVGKNNGYAAKNCDFKIVIPDIEEKLITPNSESFQSIVLHCIVSHPKLQENKTVW